MMTLYAVFGFFVAFRIVSSTTSKVSAMREPAMVQMFELSLHE